MNIPTHVMVERIEPSNTYTIILRVKVGEQLVARGAINEEEEQADIVGANDDWLELAARIIETAFLKASATGEALGDCVSSIVREGFDYAVDGDYDLCCDGRDITLGL